LVPISFLAIFYSLQIILLFPPPVLGAHLHPETQVSRPANVMVLVGSHPKMPSTLLERVRVLDLLPQRFVLSPLILILFISILLYF
jgi:hypothetical protein